MWKGVPIADDYHLRIDFTHEDLNIQNDKVLRFYIDYYRSQIEEDISSVPPSFNQDIASNPPKNECSDGISSSGSNQHMQSEYLSSPTNNKQCNIIIK